MNLAAHVSPNKDPRGHLWKKGVSPNPGGRPKLPENVGDLLRSATPEAMRTIIKIMKSDKSSPAVRAYCAAQILDRAYGKPAQQTTLLVGSVKRRAQDLSDDELATIIAGGKLPPPTPQAPLLIEGTARALDASEHNDTIASAVEPTVEPENVEQTVEQEATGIDSWEEGRAP